jgi:hypothetical protein
MEGCDNGKIGACLGALFYGMRPDVGPPEAPGAQKRSDGSPIQTGDGDSGFTTTFNEAINRQGF